MIINDIQEDYDVAYLNYLKSFKTPRFIDEKEQDTLEFEEANRLGDICTSMIYMNEKFGLLGKLTNKGFFKLPKTKFDKIVDWFLKLF